MITFCVNGGMYGQKIRKEIVLNILHMLSLKDR